MATLNTTATYWRNGGVSAIQECIGYEPGPQRTSVARYQFTSPSTGASSVSWQSAYCSLTEYHEGDNSTAWGYSGYFNWIISDDPDGYKYYIGNAGNNVSATNGSYFSGSGSVGLLPNTTYYLFVFPDNNFKTKYAIFRIGNITLTATGSYGTSNISATNANIGSASTLTISRYNNNFTHTLQYKISGQSDYTNIVVKTADTSYSWTVPATAYNYMSSSSKTVSITINCITYSGNTSIGSKTTTLTAYAVESVCKPTVSATYTLTNDASTYTGNNTTAILNWSNVSIVVSATPKKGATISSYAIIHNGTTYKNSSATINKITTGSFTYRATDSRGYVSEGTLLIPTVAYFEPTISITVVPPDTQTGDTKTSAKGNVFTGSFGSVNNSITVQYRYKENGGSYGSWITLTTTANNNKYTTAEDTITLDYRKQYIFQGRIVDSLNTKTTDAVSVVSIPVFDWSKNDFHFNVPLVLGNTTLNESMVQNMANIPNVSFSKGTLPVSTATTISLPRYEYGVIFVMSAAVSKCCVILYRSRDSANITPLILGNPTDLTITPGIQGITITPSAGAETTYIKLSY